MCLSGDRYGRADSTANYQQPGTESEGARPLHSPRTQREGILTWITPASLDLY